MCKRLKHAKPDSVVVFKTRVPFFYTPGSGGSESQYAWLSISLPFLVAPRAGGGVLVEEMNSLHLLVLQCSCSVLIVSQCL